MSCTSDYTTLIFDIGDVLFSWSPPLILSSSTWIDYERGRVSQADEFSIDSAEVGCAFQDACDSLQSNNELISVIQHLKAHSNGMLHVFAMSNITVPDYEFVRTKPVDWALFDDIFTSTGVGERKPNLSFYKTVLSSTGADPSHTICVDDKMENVLSVRSLGMRGIVFEDHCQVVRTLYNLLGDPVERGRQYLTLNAKKLLSITNNGISLWENFSQLLILEATDNQNLVNLTDTPHTWNFFQGIKPLLTTEEYPFDLDTTSLGLTLMGSPEDVAHPVMDDMLDCIDDDGIIQIYFDHHRPRFDPVVSVNAPTLFYSYGRGHQLDCTLHWICEVLLHRAYPNSMRYYTTLECFLYFLGRLLQISNDTYLAVYLKLLLIERVQERIGAEGDTLALSMCLQLCAYLELCNDVDLHTFLPLQCEDGGWEIGWIYKYGTSSIRIGNHSLATSLAVKAILEMQHFPSPPPLPSTLSGLTLGSAPHTSSVRGLGWRIEIDEHN
ncbi:HAD-like domain-containing protein [Suillus lakei]|nr:HAD-like domain-containing protein [Suillus lakei]